MKWGMKKGDEMKGCPSNSGRRLYHFAQTIEGCQTTADRTLSTLTLTKPLLTHGLRSQARSSARASSQRSVDADNFFLLLYVSILRPLSMEPNFGLDLCRTSATQVLLGVYPLQTLSTARNRMWLTRR